MITSQVVETSGTVNNNSPIQDYTIHPDDHTQPTYEITPAWVHIFHSFEWNQWEKTK